MTQTNFLEGYSCGNDQLSKRFLLSWEDLVDFHEHVPAEIPETASSSNYLVLSEQMNLSCLEFLDVFWSDSPSSHQFWRTFYTGRGDTDVMVSPWQQCRKSENPISTSLPGTASRFLHFTHPLKLQKGLPASTQCSQKQEVHLSRGPDGGVHAVITTLQTMTDVPYADAFSVKMVWHVEDIVPAAHRSHEFTTQQKITSSSCHVRVLVSVPFTKSVPWLQDEVEKGTVKEIKQAYLDWKSLAEDKIASFRAEGLAQVKTVELKLKEDKLITDTSSECMSEVEGEAVPSAAAPAVSERLSWERMLISCFGKAKAAVYKVKSGSCFTHGFKIKTSIKDLCISNTHIFIMLFVIMVLQVFLIFLVVMMLYGFGKQCDNVHSCMCNAGSSQISGSVVREEQQPWHQLLAEEATEFWHRTLRTVKDNVEREVARVQSRFVQGDRVGV